MRAYRGRVYTYYIPTLMYVCLYRMWVSKKREEEDSQTIKNMTLIKRTGNTAKNVQKKIIQT